MIRILALQVEPILIERLRVLDMFLLYPPLLHRVSLPSAIKERFRLLELQSPVKMFVRLPSTASIWQNLQLYQSAALTHLSGRTILDNGAFRKRQAVLNRDLVPLALWERARSGNAEQDALMRFLLHDFSSLPIAGKDNLFSRAGLPARGPVL